MKKRLTLHISDSKSINFAHPNFKNIERRMNLNVEKNSCKELTGKKESPFRLIGYLKKQRRGSLAVANPFDELIDVIARELKKISAKEYNDDTSLANYLFEKINDNYISGRKVKLVELIFHILKKNQKSDNEVLILKLYFIKMEKLVSLLIPLKINISDMLSKLVCQIKCEKRNKNTILFKAGDTGEKLYMLLKGKVGILIKKEKNIECTPLEFIKLLILLYLYQEETLLIETVIKNKNIINIEENGIICLLNIFKFYYFLKENNRLTKNYYSLFDFIQNEHNLRVFIQNRYNYSPMLSFDLLNYEKTTIEQLFIFYCRKIKEINKSLKFGLTGSALIANFIKRQIKPSFANRPSTIEELLNYLKPYDEGKKRFKSEQEYYQKISYINEISHNKILATSEDKYIQRLDPEKLIESIRQDTINNSDPEDIISELNVKLKAFIYYEINQLYEGNIFGELALSDPKNKRTATIITKEECYFGTIIKQVYDLSLKAAQEKLRLRNVLFFTRGPIFKGLSNNIFLNKFFYTFKKKAYQKGDILFNKGEERKNIIFVEKGELELSRTMTLNDITNIINLLGGVLDDKYLTFLRNRYHHFNKYYYNYKFNIKLCVLKDKEILGLDDMTLDDKNIFDCRCVSTERTELYELDYNSFEEAKKYNIINNNIIEFVNTKRNLFIKILLEQRNALIAYELNKIKNSQNKDKILSEEKVVNKTNRNIVLPIAKNMKISNKRIILSYTQKNKGTEDFNTFKNKNSKIFQKLEKIERNQNMINTISTKDGENEKTSNNNYKKNENTRNISTSTDKNNTNDYYIIKDTNLKSINNRESKASFLKRNNKEKNKFNSINNNTYLNKFCKSYVRKIYHSRKKLVPYISYSHSKSSKGKIIPIVLKEYNKQYREVRNNNDLNNFYIENQNIFDYLLYNEDNYNINHGVKTARATLKNEKIFFEKKIKFPKLKKGNDNNNNNDTINSNNNSKGNQTDYSLFRLLENKNKNSNTIGIIDCLCLDNWEEKQQFQKNFFSEE